MRYLLAFVLILMAQVSTTQARDVVYDGSVVTVALTVGQETRINFPSAVEYQALDDTVSILNAGQSLYITANQDFSSKRLIARSQASGQVFLFDLSTGLEADQRVHIIMDNISDQPDSDQSAHPYVLLTRHAAQQFYGPKRLRETHSGIRRISLDLSQADFLYRGSDLVLLPKAQWSYKGLFVTALLAVNTTDQRIEFDPRNIRGAFLTATAQFNVMGQSGSSTDQTMVYLISDKRFGVARP